MTPKHGKLIGMFGGCHHGEDIVGAAIVIGTTWPNRWFKPMDVSTHSSVGFIYEDGYREIYEAREGKCWQGPIPVSKVQAWVDRKPAKRRFTMYCIPPYMISADMAIMRWNLCYNNLFIWTYSKKQLGRMWLRKWLPWLPIKSTYNQVVCSEAATIIIDPPCSILRICGVSKPDLVTPVMFERAMKEICAAPTHSPADTSDAYKG